MKTTFIAITLLLGAASAPLYADEGMHDMPGMKGDMSGMQGMGDMKGHNMSGMGDQKQSTHRGQGTVNSVDAAAGKINLSHGPMQSLGWPNMTMDFPVKDAAMLKDIQPGTKVDFELEKANGGYRIVSITPSK